MTNKKILIRCDASYNIGLGHLSRCLVLANELRCNYCLDPEFACLGNSNALVNIDDSGFLRHSMADEIYSCEGEWLDELVEIVSPSCIILDIRTALPSEHLTRYKKQGVLVALIDDGSSRRLVADLMFYPPVPQLGLLDWEGCKGSVHVGWEWVIVKPEFNQSSNENNRLNPHRSGRNKTRVLLSFGGSDPHGLTFRVVSVLLSGFRDLHLVIVLGADFVGEDALESQLSKSKLIYELHRNVSDMYSLMAKCHVALVAFGTVAYELAAMGIPAAHLCLTQDHALSASSLELEGVSISLGVADQLGLTELRCKLIETLPNLIKIQNRQTRIVMNGATNIAALITSRIT